MYTDRGTKTCGGRPAAEGHEAKDAQTYASWGVDYLKEDSCNAPGDHASAFKQYGAMRDGLNKTGRPILFSLCGWNAWYAPVGKTLGNSWRTGPDDSNWGGVVKNIDILAPLSQYAGPGGRNDPCLLLSQDWSGKMIMTELQIRAQFSMWAVVSAPLLISGSVTRMTAQTLETYTNAKVIAVSQDKMGKAGTRVAGADMAGCRGKTANCTNVWSKPLSDKSSAMVFLNVGSAAATVSCDAACLSAAGFGSQHLPLTAVDLWTGKSTKITAHEMAMPAVAAEGGFVMVKVSAAAE